MPASEIADGGPTRQHPNLPRRPAAPLPDADLDVFLPSGRGRQSDPAQGHSRSGPVIPESGPEQCRRVAFPQRLVSLGGARGERNRRLDHGLCASSRRSDGSSQTDFAGRSVPSAGPVSVGRATTTPRTSIPILPGRECTTSIRAILTRRFRSVVVLSSSTRGRPPEESTPRAILLDIRFEYAPRAGLLILFPSWLTHWVHPHSGRRERIAISFNVSATPESAATSPE